MQSHKTKENKMNNEQKEQISLLKFRNCVIFCGNML